MTSWTRCGLVVLACQPAGADPPIALTTIEGPATFTRQERRRM